VGNTASIPTKKALKVAAKQRQRKSAMSMLLVLHLNSTLWQIINWLTTERNYSLLSDLTELSQLKREQMVVNKQYQIMQFGIEERKLKLLEQKSTVKMENLRAEAAHKCLNVEKDRLQVKVDLLQQRAQLLKEWVSQDDNDSALPLVND